MKKSAIGKKTETPGLRLNLPATSTNSVKTVNDMDKIEKIKDWVKKQKKETLARNSIGVITGHTFFVDANELLSFLDTLSEEPSKSLQEEIETWIPAHISIRTDETLPINPTELAEICKEWGKCIARHFAEWGAEHLRDSTKMIDKSLKEAAEEYIKNGRYLPEAFFVRPAFIAGAEWQKEQMLKDAVEGYVNYYEDSGGILMAEAQVGCSYHNGDKVRIIVLKEEE